MTARIKLRRLAGPPSREVGGGPDLRAPRQRVRTVRDVIEHIVTNIIKAQVLTKSAAAAEAHHAARREMLEALQAATV